MAYDPNIFSYRALHEFVVNLNDPVLKRLFEVVDTRDFEMVLKQLETLVSLGGALGLDKEAIHRIEKAMTSLKHSLIDAIRAMHPEHVFKVPQESCDACAAFLTPFLESGGSLFTTNYDLLLYWVLMRSGLSSTDGFGRERESADEYLPSDEAAYSDLRWGPNKEGQNVFYVHGALPLFDTGVEIVKEQYTTEGYLLEQVTHRIQDGQYPVFVTAGDGRQKLRHIRHNRYLENSYEALSTINGSLVTFGFNFGPQDAHIVKAINLAARQPPQARLRSIYIGVYSDADHERIKDLAGRLKCKVHIFDSRTVQVWG